MFEIVFKIIFQIPGIVRNCVPPRLHVSDLQIPQSVVAVVVCAVDGNIIERNILCDISACICLTPIRWILAADPVHLWLARANAAEDSGGLLYVAIGRGPQ